MIEIEWLINNFALWSVTPSDEKHEVELWQQVEAMCLGYTK